MPSTSVAQRRFFGWAEHHPEEAKREGKYPKGMTTDQMSDFASTPEKGLPRRKTYAAEGTAPTANYLEDGGHWMQGAVKHPGALTAEAKRAGMAPMTFARKHYHDPGKVGARSRFAVNAQKK